MVGRKAAGGRFFSIELKSRAAVKTALVGNGRGDRVTIEGTIGTLQRAGFEEDSVLELIGTAGTLRIDLAREDLAKPSQKLQEVKEE